MFLIAKTDFSDYVKLSANIADSEVLPQIRDAETFDFAPTMPPQLVTDLRNGVAKYKGAWSAGTNYLTGDIVSVNGTYFKALADNTASEPPSGNWSANQLMQFYGDCVKPFLVYAAYYRFLAYHGINITQFGLRTMIEDTSQDITDKRRGEILGDISTKMNVFALRINKALDASKYTFDTVVYVADSDITEEKNKIKHSPKLFAVGVLHKDYFNNYKRFNPYE